ncbi:hypothetical protein [Actinoplanes sp. NPDC049316]|uniref:hypothetical protein n=1 Tax=Actinoplanes sp. NPDC049316 TaxID=3154727 RepID=UPI003431A4D5
MKTRKAITVATAIAILAGMFGLSATAAQAAPVRPVTASASPTDSGPWPITDENGVQRSTLSIDWSTGYAIACYGGEAGDVRIELRFESGYIQRRIVPQFGCAVAGPPGAPADAGPPVAVRGVVGDFANPWHENV